MTDKKKKRQEKRVIQKYIGFQNKYISWALKNKKTKKKQTKKNCFPKRPIEEITSGAPLISVLCFSP